MPGSRPARFRACALRAAPYLRPTRSCIRFFLNCPIGGWSIKSRIEFSLRCEKRMTAQRRLMLMEDSPDNLDILRLLLQDAFEIHAFACPAEALEQIERISPELLLLDIAM